eukprot:Skav228544  [mRNA]  locus=scaffold1887:437251:440754:- [translate_table: standard]
MFHLAVAPLASHQLRVAQVTPREAAGAALRQLEVAAPQVRAIHAATFPAQLSEVSTDEFGLVHVHLGPSTAFEDATRAIAA